MAAPPEEAFVLTAAPSEAPEPEEVVVSFEAGLPVALDGGELPLADLVSELNARAGAYGIGRIDMIENRVVGIKSRELYEAPAALALITAHSALGRPGADTRRAGGEARAGASAGRSSVYDGFWFSPCAAYDAFFAETQRVVTGDVRLSLQAGAAVVTGRRSPQALYAETLASYATGETFPHDAASGFITLAGLETELAASREARLQPA